MLVVGSSVIQFVSWNVIVEYIVVIIGKLQLLIFWVLGKVYGIVYVVLYYFEFGVVGVYMGDVGKNFFF